MQLKFLKILRSPSPEILELLNNNVIGTPGLSMLYQHRGVENKIHQIADPYFASLGRHNGIAGTCCFCARRSINTGKSVHSFYIRYFSFKDVFRRKALGGRPPFRQSDLRVEINLMLGGLGLNVPPKENFFHYAYVDPRNIRSKLLCDEFGFLAVREYATIIFNRIFPKRKPEVMPLVKEEIPAMKELLSIFYKQHTMFSFENLFGPREYFVLKDHKGQILAGVQANPDQWKILSLPGFYGDFLLNTLSYLPVLNRLISKNFRFIALDGIYYAPGQEKALEILIEDLLARNGLHSAVVVADANSPQYHILRSLDLGLLYKFNNEVRGNVICRFSNFRKEEKEIFKQNPAYISAIDVT